ncbi:unnamed protein product [Paramecium sonneborni]|uniref:Uncharacterized protein n=1 Tax=Paramecium sonneborni TaxID=65129 RepID=A0A8S1NSZ8_9CILI|nr:unnamed protein product [Paramecium sonneborni]
MSILHANEQQLLREQIFKIKDKLLSLSQDLSNYHADIQESNSTAHFRTQDDEQSPQQISHENEEKSFSQLNFVDKNKQVTNQCHEFKKLKPLFKVPSRSTKVDPLIKSSIKKQAHIEQIRVSSSGRPPQILRYSLQREARIYIMSPQKITFSQRISFSPAKRI